MNTSLFNFYKYLDIRKAFKLFNDKIECFLTQHCGSVSNYNRHKINLISYTFNFKRMVNFQWFPILFSFIKYSLSISLDLNYYIQYTLWEWNDNLFWNTLITYFVNQLHNDQLQNVSKGSDLVDTATQVVQGSLLPNKHSSDEIYMYQYHIKQSNIFTMKISKSIQG